MNRNAPGYVLGFMAALCVVFGSGVATVHYATRDMLAANEQLNHNRVVSAAFDLPVSGRAAADYARAMEQALETAMVQDGRGGIRHIYRRVDEDAPVLGFTFWGMGFWDRIEGVVVLSADLQTLIRIRFLDHKETPGLGARIEEAAFLDQFEGLRPDWTAASDRRVIIGRPLPRRPGTGWTPLPAPPRPVPRSCSF
jgi:Na+-transporting NADH:ubiquinone oxidoreductase subunit C